MIDIQMPPQQYVHPYPGPVLMFDGLQQKIQRDCLDANTPAAPNTSLYGCQFFIGNVCVVLVTTNLDPQDRINVIIHEIAHCNGWRHQ